MKNGITIKINLIGVIGPPVKHIHKQTVSVNVAPVGQSKPEMLTRKIKHTDRRPTVATKVTNISPQILNRWVFGDCPYWEDQKSWKKMSNEQRIESYVMRFDEGFGVTYELI